MPQPLPNSSTETGHVENMPRPFPTTHNGANSAQNRSPSRSNFWLKISFVFGVNCMFLLCAYFLLREIIMQRSIDQEIVLESSYQKSLWENYGEVFEPIIEIPIYYPEKGFQKEQFLLDSGALVSSLPREKAETLGFSLAMLPRSTFKGFGNTTTFAYRANLKALLGNDEVNLPVVFTETAGTKSILGRTGFFENYSIYFDSKAQKIQIKI